MGNAWVVELVDTQDLKSCILTDVRVQVPSRVQNQSESGERERTLETLIFSQNPLSPSLSV